MRCASSYHSNEGHAFTLSVELILLRRSPKRYSHEGCVLRDFGGCRRQSGPCTASADQSPIMCIYPPGQRANLDKRVNLERQYETKQNKKQNNTASDDSTEAWSGHLKHSHFDKTVTGKHQKSSPGETRTGKSSRSSSRNSSRHSSKNSSRMSSLRGAESGDGTSKKRRGAEEEKTPGDSVGASDLAFSSEQDLSNAPKSQASGKAGALEKEINVDTSGAMNAPTAAVKKAQVESSGIQGHGLSSSVPPQEGGSSSVAGSVEGGGGGRVFVKTEQQETWPCSHAWHMRDGITCLCHLGLALFFREGACRKNDHVHRGSRVTIL